MRATFEEELALYIDRLAQRWPLRFIQEEIFNALIRKGLEFRASQDVDSKLAVSKVLFSEEMLGALISAGESYKPSVVSFMWDRLESKRIFQRNFEQNFGMYANYSVDYLMVVKMISNDSFHNIFYPASKLPDRYKEAIVALDVIKGEDQFRGSGFIVAREGDRRHFLVTCRHNVDPADHITVDAIRCESGRELPALAFNLSATLDLAACPLAENFTGPVFAFAERAEMFDRVYTLGYPNIPASEGCLAGHSGEINGRTMLYLQGCEALIISNLVSPGSSGCAVLNENGECVGMTIRWLEGEWAGEKMRFSAALPASAIQNFLAAMD